SAGVFAGVGGYALARKALAPIDSMATQARTISAEKLGDRLSIENPEDELGKLGTVFNAMLGRLQAAFDQLRRFTADASHELRTPLTAIRSVGEVALQDQRSSAEYRDVIGSKLEDNAIKYPPPGSHILVRVQGGGDKQVFLEVIDQGPGIPAEHQPYVFDRFFRVDKARTREWGGAGLGLSITRWAVEAHGGGITLESEKGHGSTFRVFLPLAKDSSTSSSSRSRNHDRS